MAASGRAGGSGSKRGTSAGSAIRTFLIADVRGYTRYTVEHGDEAAARLAQRFAELARQSVAARGGRVVELRGDEALALFTSARGALHAAVDLQTALADERARDPTMPLHVGIGLDAGEAIPVGKGFRGAALNLAARLCALAEPGEVLASETVTHLARRVDDLVYEDRGAAQLKGFAEPVRVVRVGDARMDEEHPRAAANDSQPGELTSETADKVSWVDTGKPAPPPTAAATDPPARSASPRWLTAVASLPALVRRRPMQNTLLVILVLVVIGATVGLLRHISQASASRATAQALFSDNPSGAPGHSNEVRLEVSGLAATASGYQYDAWLMDQQGEHFIALGTLKQQGANLVMSYHGSGKTADTNLLGAGNTVEITLEHGAVEAPAGTVVLSGTFPPQAFVHIGHLLVAYPATPNQIGLVVGLLDQATRLDNQALQLQGATQSHNALAISCHAQSIVDIIEGNAGAHYQPLAAACASVNSTEAGDGFGLLQNGNNTGYLLGAADHASLAAHAPDATSLIKTHAQHVQTCITNIEGWAQTIDADAVTLVQNPSDVSQVGQITALSDHVLNGQDLDADESVDPVPGEGGARTAYAHAQLMATLNLTPSQ